MKQLLLNIVHKIGLDKAIAYSAGARIVQGFTGVGSVFFVATFLTGVEQGFYYTFGSILALQVFFELGLTGIMTQYVAHEAAHLTIQGYDYKGDSVHKSRLASLLRFCVKWYSAIAIFAFVFLVIFGFIYFTRYGDTQAYDVQWKIPWLLICFSTGLKLFQSPFTSILTGLGFVKDTGKISFYQQLIIPAVSWLGLACGLKLYVTGIGYLVSILVWFIYVFRHHLLDILLNLWKVTIVECVNYIKEIFPYQWRIALSWISGYFIFQLFNPVLFATEGAVVAGQMGMTLSALNAIQAFSMSWLNTKVPLYSKLIAQKNYNLLDTIFNKTLKQMVFICSGLLILFGGAIVILKETQLSLNGNILGDRFLSYVPMVLMMIPILLQQFTNSWATYLRCHKKEPFLINSVVGGILCLLSTTILGHKFGLYGVTIGYCAITILLFPWGYYLYYSNKKRWHE